MGRWELLVGVALVLVACGGPSSTAGGSSDYGLIHAQHKDCQSNGLGLARYLDSGQPTSLDPDYGNERQRVLSLSGEQRSLFIRQTADAYMQRCDAAEAAQEAADAAVAERQRQQNAQLALIAKEKATCGTFSAQGAKWDEGYAACRIDYRSPDDGQAYHYSFAFDSSGNVAPIPGGPTNAQECATHWGPNLKGYWHADTYICSI